MADFVKMLGYKITFPKAVLFGFGIFLIYWLIPFEGAKVFKSGISFESTVLAIWFLIAGLWYMIEGIASIPETKKGRSRTGGAMIIGIGIFAFVLALTFFFGGHDLVYGSEVLSWASFIVMVLVVGMWFAHVKPELIDRKSFLKALEG